MGPAAAAVNGNFQMVHVDGGLVGHGECGHAGFRAPSSFCPPTDYLWTSPHSSTGGHETAQTGYGKARRLQKGTRGLYAFLLWGGWHRLLLGDEVQEGENYRLPSMDWCLLCSSP